MSLINTVITTPHNLIIIQSEWPSRSHQQTDRSLPGGQPVGGGRSLPVQEGNALQLDVDIIQTLKQEKTAY